MDETPAELAERQHGLVTRTQLRALGLTRSSVDLLVTSPSWQRVTDEVVRRVGAPRSTAQRVLAGVLDSGPAARLSYEPAARWWGVPGCSLRQLHTVRTSSSSRRSELAIVHEVRSLPPSWVTVLRSVPIARPELVALHLFATCSAGRAERLVERMWSMRLLSGRSIAAFLDDLGRRGRNGTKGLRDYVEVRGLDYTPTATNLEARAMQLFREAGIDMRRQVDSGGAVWVGRVDFRHEYLPLIAEIQSEAYHSALLDREADRRRSAALRAAGFVVVELTDEQVWTRPQEVVDAIAAAVRRLS